MPSPVKNCDQCGAKFQFHITRHRNHCSTDCFNQHARLNHTSWQRRYRKTERGVYAFKLNFSPFEKWKNRCSPKRDKERAMRATLQMEINALRFHRDKTYLTDEERHKIRTETKRAVGSPRVYIGKERRLSR